MDSQRSLFKKFFGNSNGNRRQDAISDNNTNPTGFNPPKFQFDKKKLGIMNKNVKISDNIEDKVMKDIESTEIDDSELGDHLDDWNETTMNTTKIVENGNFPVNSTENYASAELSNMGSSNHNQSSKENAIYRSILQKNHQKYNLSNQLELFNENIEIAIQICGDKRNKMELLVLGLDEKIGKI